MGGQTSNSVTLVVPARRFRVNAVVNGSFSSPDWVAAPGTIVSILAAITDRKMVCRCFRRPVFRAFPPRLTAWRGRCSTWLHRRSNQRRRADGAARIGHGPVQSKFRRPQRELQLEDVGGDPGHVSRRRPFQGIRKKRAVLVCQYRLARHAFINGHGAEFDRLHGLPVAATCGQPGRRGDYIQILSPASGRATPGGDPNGKVLPTVQWRRRWQRALTDGAEARLSPSAGVATPCCLWNRSGLCGPVPGQCSGAGWRHAGR